MIRIIRTSLPAQRKFLFAFLIAWAIFLFFPKEIFAAGFTLSITQAPSHLNQEEEGSVSISFVGDPQYYSQKTYYLRLVFSPVDTSNYFGFTQNNSGAWISTTNNKTEYFSFDTSPEATWSGQIKVKLDPDSPFFSGSGDYQLKVGRYTSASDLSADWSDPITISLVDLTPTPTPTPASSQTPPRSPTPSPIPSPSPSPSPSPRPSPSPSPKPTKTPEATLSGEILGEESSPAGFYPWEATEEGKAQENTSLLRNKFIPKLFLSLGLVFLFASAFWIWYNFLKERQE